MDGIAMGRLTPLNALPTPPMLEMTPKKTLSVKTITTTIT